MKIDKILLYNFGSYEGEAVFDTRERDGKNIVIIGGKNGAGKTTLFTAIRVCLYGYMSMGYKNANSFYTRAITKLINNSAKMTKPTNSYVSVEISLNNGHGIDSYTLERSWVLADSLSEQFSIIKNGVTLSADEAADFAKYMLALIPPELFNLYFFDGEKIADFFMNEGSNIRIKEAFLTVCGYDTFDIMRKNFRRIRTGTATKSPALDEYLTAKEALATARQDYNDLSAKLKECIDEAENCNADLDALERDYASKGGITQEEWNEKLFLLRNEERKRENWNLWLRKWANEVVPFLMIRDQILAVKQQVLKENSGMKYRNFCEVMDTDEIQNILGDISGKVKDVAFSMFGSCDMQILNLSFEQSANLIAQIDSLLAFDVTKVKKCKTAIKRSISTSAKIRQELENSSIAAVQEYMSRRTKLYETKSKLLSERLQLEQAIASQKDVVSNAEAALVRIQNHVVDEIKRASINEISAKAIIMIDRLQTTLYHQQIAKVEDFFCKEIRTLMRKTHFIDNIKIDDDFNIHIYRNEDVEPEKLLQILMTHSDDQIRALLGNEAYLTLQHLAKADTYSAIELYCKTANRAITLPVEIEKSSLSNGEKQIFIMALYRSLVHLSNHEIPFIIDTPFARIDTEHRENISRYFFRELHGQVFILSTNEEINSTHVNILKDKILATYMLENTDNKKTVVQKDAYFEVRA